jgi:hypothetical protein
MFIEYTNHRGAARPTFDRREKDSENCAKRLEVKSKRSKKKEGYEITRKMNSPFNQTMSGTSLAMFLLSASQKKKLPLSSSDCASRGIIPAYMVSSTPH